MRDSERERERAVVVVMVVLRVVATFIIHREMIFRWQRWIASVPASTAVPACVCECSCDGDPRAPSCLSHPLSQSLSFSLLQYLHPSPPAAFSFRGSFAELYTTSHLRDHRPALLYSCVAC